LLGLPDIDEFSRIILRVHIHHGSIIYNNINYFMILISVWKQLQPKTIINSWSLYKAFNQLIINVAYCYIVCSIPDQE